MADDASQLSKNQDKPDVNRVDALEDLTDEEQRDELLKSEETQNVLKEFDAFEVEEMPESNELQERRKKVKSRLQALEVDASPESPEPFGVSEGSIMDLLREARLTPKQVFSCCSVLLIFGVIGVFVFGNFSLGIPSWVESWFDEEPEDSTTDPDDSEDPEISYTDESLLTGIFLGQAVSDEDQSTEAGEGLGSEAEVDENLQKWILDFSKLYESVGVDVNGLLNQSNDRREALADYLEELRALQYLAEQDVRALQEEMDLISEEFSLVERLRDEEEARFFEQLNDLNAYATGAALDSFVDYGQEVVRLRAHFLAREQLLDYFEQVLPFVETKIRDIELNEEALVKGVKVIEVDGSDLELIIDETDL